MTIYRRETVHPDYQRQATADRPTAPSRLSVGVVALVAALGVLAVAVAYTAGRTGSAKLAWAGDLYWLGQLLIIGPVAARILSRRPLSYRETITLIVVLTISEYLVKICYSPAAFTYADELMHWRSATNVMQTGRLFIPNYLLSISSDYPGLEEVTSALVSVSGLSIFSAGLIVAGTAHLLFVCILFVLFRNISGSYRLAGVAVLLYSSESLFQSFDSMFVYQTVALPFLGLTVLALYRLAAPGGTGRISGWVAVAAAAILAVVPTHHVTSYMLVATLGVTIVGAVLTHNRTLTMWASVAAFALVSLLVVWVVFIAPSTVSYLQPTVEAAAQAVRSIFTGSHAAASSTPAAKGPLKDEAIAGIAVLVMSALVPVGWWQVWQRYRRVTWIVALAIGAVSWYVIVAVRLFVGDGSELAGRASTFVFVPAGFMATLAVIRLADKRFRLPIIHTNPRRWTSIVSAAAVVVALILIFNGLINGWPPYWERLPGPYLVAGAERSVGPDQIASANWALTALGPGNRFATDEGDLPVLGSYGNQNPIRDDSFLYTSPVFSEAAAQQVQAQSISYVLVDRRLSGMLPASGQYFAVDVNANKYTHPLPLADLTKFDHIAGVARIYDAGNIVIYDLNGSAYYGT